MILIIGSGVCAANTAKEILAGGNEVIIASREKQTSTSPDFLKTAGIESKRILKDARIISCSGCDGDFTIVMTIGATNISDKISSVVIAEEYEKIPNLSAYGLKASPAILPVSVFTENEHYIHDIIANNPYRGKVVFLTGIGYESNPATTEGIMTTALKLQKNSNLQTYILTGNLKVAGYGLEKLYRETKTAGAVYFKFTDTYPLIFQNSEGKVTVELIDEITRLNFMIAPDLTIVDETISPSSYLKDLAAVFGLHKGSDGFLQSGNLHRTGIYTNRKGIFVAGPSRSIPFETHNKIDSANAAFLTCGIAVDKKARKRKAEINRNLCVKCLTCYRCCPYSAIDLDVSPCVLPDACEGCGICFAECPSCAVSINFQVNWNEPDEIGKIETIEKTSPRIIAFCCSRSAAGARELALRMGYSLPSNMVIVEVPCSGLVSKEDILSAFLKKAEGVLVLTCHFGNCHSEYGNLFAGKRIEQLKNDFSPVVFEQERLAIKTIASNMGFEFAQTVRNFEKTLITLGPISSKMRRTNEQI